MKKVTACVFAMLAAGVWFCYAQVEVTNLRTVTRATEQVTKGERIMEYKPTGDEILMVHDGKRVLAKHGAGNITGSGNPDAVFVVGTAAEVDAEIIRLKLE